MTRLASRHVLAQRVRQLRHERGWSQEDLAEHSGLHRTYIGAIERAERNVGVAILDRLAAALAVNASALLAPDSLSEN